MLAIELLVEEILRLQNTVMYLQAQLREARKMSDARGPNMGKQWLDDIGARLEQIKREELAAVPSYCGRFSKLLVIMLDSVIHTDEHPFCDDPSCGCHDDVELIMEHLEHPFDGGLLTSPEYFRLKEGKQL